MAYTPPPGNNLTFNFVAGGYTPPVANGVNFAFGGTAQAIFPTGFVAVSFGTPTIYNASQLLAVSGWTSSIVPTGANIINATQSIFATGLFQFAAGTPTIVNNARLLAPTGFLSGGYGSQTIFNLNRYLTLTGFTSAAYGTPSVINKNQFITVTGFTSAGYGAASIENFTRYLTPSGFTSNAYGTASLINRNRYLLAAGFTGAAYGTAFVSYVIRTLTVSGFSSAGVGTASLVNRNRYLTLGGVAPGSVGTQFISYYIRTIPVGGIAPPSQTAPNNSNRQLPSPIIQYRTQIVFPGGVAAGSVGSSDVSHDLRYIDQAGNGIDSLDTGTPDIDYRTKTIYPPFILGPSWGITHVYRNQFIDVTGIASTWLAGFPELVIGTRRLPIQTFGNMLRMGEPNVYNYVQNAGAQGWLDTQFNYPIVYNLNQQITVGAFSNNTDPTSWSAYEPHVDNRNRILAPFGTNMSKYGVSALIYNNAQPLVPPGLDATLWGNSAVTHKHRTIFAEGWDSFYNERYAVVYNTADVLGPATAGLADGYGRPSVENLNRKIKYVGFPSAEYGLPFIAYRIRTITPHVFVDVPAAFPEVRFNPYPIAPVGIPQEGQVGGVEIFTRIPTIRPFSLNVHDPWIGELRIENRNKSFMPYGYDQAEYGRADVQNYIRYLNPSWSTQELFGSALIAQRNRTVYAVTISVPTFSVLHRIRKDSPDPPGPQYVELNAEDSEGNVVDGQGIRPLVPGTPTIKLMTINAIGIGETAYGLLRIVSNNILPRFIYDDGLMGTPTLIYDRTFAIPSINRSDVVSAPRMTPWNIYAPRGDQMPFGYHPDRSDQAYPIGQANNSSFDGSRYPWFGHTTFTNQHRSIGPVPDHLGDVTAPLFGNARFTLRKQYVYPTGIKSIRWGQIIFLDVPQYVDLSDPTNPQGIPSDYEFGDTNVAFPAGPVDPNKYVFPAGRVMTTFGTTKIELFNREIKVPGIAHAGGTSGTNPWGNALVGYPRTYTISAGVMTRWGTLVIEYKNRHVYPTGWINSSLEDGNFDDFRFPMKVKRYNPKTTIPGISSFASGSCTVTFGLRTVYGRGIDSYNAGNASVRTVTHVSVTGWDSSVFGDIDRWEAGKIKAHGDDLSTVGTPTMRHTLRQISISEFVMPAPKVTPALSPLGIPPIAFAGPSVTNPYGCNTRVITPLTVVSTHNVPAPAIT